MRDLIPIACLAPGRVFLVGELNQWLVGICYEVDFEKAVVFIV
ncbi:MAG: hypothetical protein AAGB31_11360 [Bdellovibrio sp.]